MHPFNGSIAKIITIDNYSAKRTVLDIIKSLFTGFHNPFLLRAELARLFH